MKQPFDLHWQLRPYDPPWSKQLLRFDVAFPVDEIVFQDGDRHTKLSNAELNKPAVRGTITRMNIVCRHEPFSWAIVVRNARGIRCRDVFEAIHVAFDEKLTLGERVLVRNRRAVDNAFRLRCNVAPGRPAIGRSLEWKRVDVLLDQTIFLGLTPPKFGTMWVLNLGSRPAIPPHREHLPTL